MSTPPRRSSRPPRYSHRSLPPYRHELGKTPHPERDPAGHSFGRREEAPQGWSAEGWRENELYLYGVDLFNLGYWWEAHAAWEALWQTSRSEAAGRFLQGLIQIAAALVQDRAGRRQGARRLAAKGLANLRGLVGEPGEVDRGRSISYMGVDIGAFDSDCEQFLESGPHEGIGPPLLVLA